MHRYFLFNRKKDAAQPCNTNHAPGNGLTEEEITTQLLAGIEHLPEKYREVIVLHYIEDQTIHDIKTTMGISESTVRNRLNYGLFLLKNCFSNKPNNHV
jgi:RNA polymerase sigma-70 factor (ECF subfamily)